MKRLIRTPNILCIVILVVASFGLTTLAFSQPGNPGDGEDPDVPITGIEWLLIGGGLLGAKKIYERFKDKP